MRAARESAQEEAERLLDRLETADVHTNAVCTLHPDALAQAAALDAERAAGRPAEPAARPGRRW